MLTVDTVANRPLVILNLAQDKTADTRGIRAVETMSEFLTKQRERVFLVVDMRDLSISIDTMIQNMNYVIRQAPIFTHPMLRETMVVTDDDMIARAIAGLDSPIFGNVNVKVFARIEDAIIYVDSKLAAG